jgi:folliculin
MNAIIGLCHFCDDHGPRTLFCTQAHRYSYAENKKIWLNDVDSSNTSVGLAANSSNTTTNSHIENCKACKAFDRNLNHYVSYDANENVNVCYVSQSTLNDTEVFALVRKACLRTLHSEIYEDPIYFDDDKNGSVIGYEFNVKDSEGRGFQRAYSLVIIMKDRIYLQHLWSFLAKQISFIASNIKVEAQQKFDKEMKEKENAQHSNETAKFLSLTPKKHSNNRGLIELTDDPLIFAKLHMWFTWILRMSACQISEEFMHAPLREDLQVKLERDELNEFWNANTSNNNNNNHNMSKSNSFNEICQFELENKSSMAGNTSVNDDEMKSCTDQNIDYNKLFLDSFHVESLRELIKVCFSIWLKYF